MSPSGAEGVKHMRKVGAGEYARAIREHCLICSGGSRKEVEHCLVKNCRLWPYRCASAERATAAEGREATAAEGQMDMMQMLEA